MIEVEQVNRFWVGWVDGKFITIHLDLEILIAILRNIK